MNIKWRFGAMLVLVLGATGFMLVGAHAAGFGGESPSAASAAKNPRPNATPTTGPRLPAASIELMATPDEIICDGAHTTRVRVHLRDASGDDVRDGMPVYFSMNGRAGYPAPKADTTSHGIAETEVRATFDPFEPYRPFFVQVDVGRLQASIRVFCLPPADCVPGVPCTPCDGQTSPPQVSPPPCPPSPPQCVPVSPPQAFSPPCQPPTECDPISPPQSVSPPCFVPTPPSPPPCTLASPPQSPLSCATPTPGCSPFEPLSPPCVPPAPGCWPTSPPCVPPCTNSPQCFGLEYAIELDCDVNVEGIQSNCTVPAGTSALDVAVVFENHSQAETSLAAFNFIVHDSDTSRLNPPPGSDDSFDANPDFNQADLTTSWACNEPTPTANNGLDGPGRAGSFLSCYTFLQEAPPVVVGAGGKINLAIIHYAIPPNAPEGAVELVLDEVSAASFDTITLVACSQWEFACPPPTIMTIGSGASGGPSPATPTPAPTQVPTATATATPASPCADVTGDGVVGRKDVLEIARQLRLRRPDLKYDVNGDGKVNAADLFLAASQLGRRC